jgi:hypothetical protein
VLCTGSVGAVFCLEASRLARNGRDWHHLLELCSLVGPRSRWRGYLRPAPTQRPASAGDEGHHQ